MYTLRKITGDNIEMNMNLGNSYTVIQKQINLNEFEHTSQKVYDGEAPDFIYAYVVNEDGSKINPLSKKQKCFIMTDRGRTFDNLTFR